MPQDTSGQRYLVSFDGDIALKHLRPSDLNCSILRFINTKKKILAHSYWIGENVNKLEYLGVNTPKMRGLSLGGVPFLAMQRLDLTPYVLLNDEDKIEAAKQYARQKAEVISRGYGVGDLRIDTNCGFVKAKGKLYFFDFDNWTFKGRDFIGKLK